MSSPAYTSHNNNNNHNIYIMHIYIIHHRKFKFRTKFLDQMTDTRHPRDLSLVELEILKSLTRRDRILLPSVFSLIEIDISTYIYIYIERERVEVCPGIRAERTDPVSDRNRTSIFSKSLKIPRCTPVSLQLDRYRHINVYIYI
jgi:hypothetical protein